MAILNYGSLNLDRAYTVDHFVRPGETLASKRMETFCGGKGLNQSIALAKAGAQVFHAGKVGRDGAKLKSRLAEFGVDTRFVIESDIPSGHAIIQVNCHTGENCILLYGGANHEITDIEIDQALAFFHRGDILLLQNEINATSEIMQKAFSLGLEIAFNPSPIGPEINSMPLSCIRYFLLNEIEGHALTGETDPEKIAKDLLSRFPNSVIVLTLGGDGSYYCDKNEAFFEAAVSTNVVDTTGAGDTFTGYFLSLKMQGRTPKECMHAASLAASIAVSRKGASDSIPSRQELPI